MKAKILLAALISLALGQIAGILAMRAGRLEHSGDRPPPPEAPAPIKTDSGPVEGASSEAGAGSEPPIDWRSIDSDDYRELIANLRSVGCPEETVRDILLGRVNAYFAEREAVFRFMPADASKPWLSRSLLTDADLEAQKAWREVQQEKGDLLEKLLGISMPLAVMRSTHTRNYEEFESALLTLPPQKRDAVQALKEKYWEDSDALKEKFKDGPRQDYVEEYRRLNSEHERELMQILGEKQTEEFLMRTSVTGGDLAAQLADFGPTEEEFRGIFRLMRGFEEETGRVGGQYGMVKVDSATRAAARERMVEEMQALLGERRFAEYQRAQDPAYRDLLRLVENRNLSRETAVQAFELKRNHEEAVRRLNADTGAEAFPGEQQAGLLELETKFQNALAALFPEPALAIYRRMETGTLEEDAFDP